MSPSRSEPDWRVWVWVCLAGVLAALVLAQPAVFLSAVLLAVAVVLSLSWHLPGLGAFQARRRIVPDAVFTGDSTRVEIEVRNRCLLPYVWSKLVEPRPRGLESEWDAGVFTLWPRRAVAAGYRVVCRRKGVYAFGPLRLELRDPLGFYGHVLECPAGGVLTVFPRVYPVCLPGLRPAEPYGKHRSLDRSVENPASPTGVRDYVPGDPPGRIHWKLTAHTGGLKTREFDLTGCGTLEILCDVDAAWFDPEGEVLEFACSVAASVAHAALCAGDSVGLHLVGRDELHLVARSGLRHLEAVLGLLVAAEPERGAALEAVVARLRGLAPRSTVFVVSPAPPAVLAEPVTLLRDRGHPVSVALVGRAEEDLEACSRLASLGARVWRAALTGGEIRLLVPGGAVEEVDGIGP